MEAEQIVARADEERQAIIAQAKRDAGAEEQQYADRIAELRASFVRRRNSGRNRRSRPCNNDFRNKRACIAFLGETS